jgi:prepilin-type N-terminal cleavage/methylation domain-containing protein
MLKNRLRTAATTAESGFTLIELLIVIVVLGILAGIVVFGVGTFKADATAAACKADVKTVSVASDAFIAKTGAPAADVDALVTAKYLKSAPLVADGIVYVAATGAVSATGCP